MPLECLAILMKNGQIDRRKLRKIDEATGNRFTPLEQLVPRIIPAGEVAGTLNAKGSELLGGLLEGTPFAAPEGDQQTTLLATAANKMELALSTGTSFAGNLPCRTKIVAENETIQRFGNTRPTDNADGLRTKWNRWVCTVCYGTVGDVRETFRPGR